jgi:uncharacterized protein YhbP (UPF0306 family)
MTTGPAPAEVRAALGDILSGCRMLTLATVSPAGLAHANIAFFAFGPDFRLWVVSPESTEHARNLVHNPSASITVFDSDQTRAQRRGVQLFGTMSRLEGGAADDALDRFAERFADVHDEPVQGSPRAIYEFVPDRAKVFDEKLLLPGDYVEIGLVTT